mmetsp:Transcript_59177/g.180458  ORF Transcript_59177/g.180458 Transcript_59177/m.180458 type:complete len:275 (-) Transcript_59177:62-886(-)
MSTSEPSLSRMALVSVAWLDPELTTSALSNTMHASLLRLIVGMLVVSWAMMQFCWSSVPYSSACCTMKVPNRCIDKATLSAASRLMRGAICHWCNCSNIRCNTLYAYLCRASFPNASAPRFAISSMMNWHSLGFTATMIFWSTWFAWGQRTTSHTCPRRDSAMAKRVSSLCACSKTCWTKRQPSRSCDRSRAYLATRLSLQLVWEHTSSKTMATTALPAPPRQSAAALRGAAGKADACDNGRGGDCSTGPGRRGPRIAWASPPPKTWGRMATPL